MPDQQLARRGVLLAGGSGTRLSPVTRGASKHLLPVFDKPLIYYPLCSLMQAGIRELLVITTPRDADAFQQLLGDGTQWGLKLRYAEQPRPEGIAQALLIAADFLKDHACALALGDNILYGEPVTAAIARAASRRTGATIFTVPVDDPTQYGIAEWDAAGRIRSLAEKPVNTKSRDAVAGLYFYDEHAASLAAQLQPSARGELEITDLNRLYLERGQLEVERLRDDALWFDAGTPELLLAAANRIARWQAERNQFIGCVEEVAYRNGFITIEQVRRLAADMPNAYGDYLRLQLVR